MEVEIPVGSIAKLVSSESTTNIQINREAVTNQTDTLSLKSGKYLIEYFHFLLETR